MTAIESAGSTRKLDRMDVDEPDNHSPTRLPDTGRIADEPSVLLSLADRGSRRGLDCRRGGLLIFSRSTRMPFMKVAPARARATESPALHWAVKRTAWSRRRHRA